MALPLKTINSRLGRRIFATFVACALIPVVVLAALALYQVTDQLKSQAYQRLRRATKSHGRSIYEHLLFCADELKLADVRNTTDVDHTQERFIAIGRRFPDGRYDTLFGEPIPAIGLSLRQQAHLDRGEPLLVATQNERFPLVLLRQFDAGQHLPGLLVGRIRESYLWGIEKGNTLPPLSEFAVMRASGLPLYSTADWMDWRAAFERQATEQQPHVKFGDTAWLVAHSTLFLEPKFGAASWSLVVVQPEDHLLAPIARFKLIFILVVVLALMLVVGLSLFNLRRSLGPIDALRKGARRIAQKDFSYRVAVTSRDEFRELAESFNFMASQLGKQFKYLVAQAEIDHATLSGQTFDQIAGLSITRLLKDYQLMQVAISRVNTDDPDEALTYIGDNAFPDGVTSHPHHIQPSHLNRFRDQRQWVVLQNIDDVHLYLSKATKTNSVHVTVFPVHVDQQLYALLTIACRTDQRLDDDTLSLIRQVADHLTVAWSNLNLIQDLRRLTIGSMQALARAVDAKSSWTAGHSARVMRIAHGIAQQLALPPHRIDQLDKAALLHDIGKIGISSRILDKPGRLTEDEFSIIRTHPVIGHKILAPIPAFKELLPMVRQHHERWDGNGYPDGLAGESITLEARILAVADVYDAMTSDRPYRDGMEVARAIAIIQSESGSQLDPSVVDAFLKVMQTTSVQAA